MTFLRLIGPYGERLCVFDFSFLAPLSRPERSRLVFFVGIFRILVRHGRFPIGIIFLIFLSGRGQLQCS